jgi:hypothetical protein
MSSALCIDFGTSSIRAVFRDEKNNRHVLPLGLVTEAKSIDEASIRCEIHIDSNGKYLRYGENAFRARGKLTPTDFYESSPKLWLLHPENLDKPAFSGLKVTRRELLAGLIAYGIFAAKKAISHLKIKVEKDLSDIRIAHPVWKDGFSERANQELLKIGYAALKISDTADLGEIQLAKFISHFKSSSYTNSLHPKSDVIEPIAAALELLNRKFNVRQICAVIDVGAGTTDIGLFYSIVTDRHADRLIPLSSTRSVFKAGNTIDEILYEMLVKKSSIKEELRLYDVRTRIRQIKEFLFENEFVQELGIRITLEELQGNIEIIKMAEEIRECFLETIKADKKRILNLNQDLSIDIVMAGGGGSVPFIRIALSTTINIGSKNISINFCNSEGIHHVTYGATHERLAVALGGADNEYDNLRHEHEKLTAIPSLGFAKQQIHNTSHSFEPITKQTFSTNYFNKKSNDNIIQLKNDIKESKNWREKINDLLKIAETGNVHTQFEIAEQLINRSSQYYLEAMKWFVRAARQGHHESQLKLVNLLLNGTAIETDYTNAYFWLLVSASSGNKNSLDESKKIRQFLKASDAEKLQFEALSWRPRNEIPYYYPSQELSIFVGFNLVTKKSATRTLLEYANSKRLLNISNQTLHPDTRLSTIIGATPIKITNLENAFNDHLYFRKIDYQEPVFIESSKSVQESLLPKVNTKNSQKPKTDKVTSSQQVITTPFDELKILELIRHSKFLKKLENTVAKSEELIKWSKRKDIFESAFLAKYCGVTFDTSAHLTPEIQRKLEAWLTFSKRRDL